MITLSKSETRHFKPRQRETSADWAQRAAWLPNEGTAEPGKYDLAKTPWAKEVLNTLDDTFVNRVVMQSCRQVAKTTIGQMWCGRSIVHDPAPFMLVQADGQGVKAFNRERMWPFFETTPELRELKDPNNDNWNLDNMHFTSGMWLTAVGSKSIMGLSQRPIKRIWFEEVNKYKASLGDHSDPLSEATHCTNTFFGGTIYASSTPTTQHGMISILLEKCEELRWWYLECPHCSKQFTMNFDREGFERDWKTRFKFDRHPEEPLVITDAWWECEHCGERIDESQKRRLQEAGRWKAIRKLKSRKAKSVGFQLCGLNSLAANMNWVSIAERWVRAVAALNEARPNIIPMRDFFNNVLGMTWEVQDYVNDHEAILAKRTTDKAGQVPDNVKVILAGFDRHGADYHYVVYGFSDGSPLGMHLIQHGVIAKTWELLQTVLKQKFLRQNGSIIQISGAGMDSGYEQEDVFSLCRQTQGFIMPIKGSDNDRPRPWPSKIDPNLPSERGNIYMNSPVNRIKDEVSSMISVSMGMAGGIEFNADIDINFARHMVGQERVGILKTDRHNRQRMVHVWQDRQGFDVHFWDATVLTLALAYALQVDLRVGQMPVTAPAAPPPPRNDKPEKDFLDTGNSWLGTGNGGWL